MSSDSTISDEDVPEYRDRQSMIEYYVDELILHMVENPHESTPQLFRRISQFGPCVRPEHIIHIFGGGIIFRRTCRRLHLIRDAALRGTLSQLPRDLGRWGGPEDPELEPPFHDFRDWWCPHIYDRHLFWFEGVLSLQPGMYRDIVRYPTHTDTDEFFGNMEENDNPSDSESEDWAQPPDMLNMIPEMHFEELHDLDPEWQDEEVTDESMEDPDEVME